VAQHCLDATGYRAGPFHVDVIFDGAAPVFIEMGFRLSGGGLVGLVKRVTGVDWAEQVVGLHLGESRPALPAPRPAQQVVGQVTVVDEGELAIADRLRRGNAGIDVQRAAVPAAEVPVEDSARLAADRLRHTGIGRVVISGDIEAVRKDLRRCVAARLVV
jgi:hypothetical protein